MIHNDNETTVNYFSQLPFYLKGNILEFVGNYKFRKTKKEEFVLQLSLEKLKEIELLIITIPPIHEWKGNGLWRVYVEFGKFSPIPIWRIKKQNYFHSDNDNDDTIPIDDFCYYYEKDYFDSNNIYRLRLPIH